MSAGAPDDNERYEPLPGLLALPGFLVRKLGRRARGALGLATAIALMAAVVAAIVLIPQIDRGKRDLAERERRASEAALAARTRELRAEQRPHRGAVAAVPGVDRSDRRSLVRALERAIAQDARARVRVGRLSPPPPRFSTCELLPHEPDPVKDLAQPLGRYRCVAVTSELPRGAGLSSGGVVGHPFRALVDFQAARFTWCKVSGVPGEGGYTGRSLVRLPRACSG